MRITPERWQRIRTIFEAAIDRPSAMRDHFLEEACDDPAIARLVDGGTTEDGVPYIVMEYVEGRPIDVNCREEDLGIEERLRLFIEVSDAVAHAHQHLVVHRNLEPSNILVADDGRPKLLDFGIAKLLDPERPGAGLTRTGMAALTPEYASPEQVLGESITTASDVYSLGVLLYELLVDPGRARL